MLNKDIKKLLNDQINKEFYSAYFYLSMYTYYTSGNLNGFANWFLIQTQEERDHAMLFVQYILNSGEEVELLEVQKPNNMFADAEQPLKDSLEHERFITSSINNIYDIALSQKDFRTTQFLDWFVKEQGEEEKNSEDNLKKYQLFGRDSKSLYLLDQELSSRVYVPPTLVL